MIRRPPRSTPLYSSAASDVYKRQKDNLMDGEGVWRRTNGEKYKGMFKMGRKDGRAIEISADGTRFDGYYKDGERDGAFTEYDSNGNVLRKGTYTNGRLNK